MLMRTGAAAGASPDFPAPAEPVPVEPARAGASTVAVLLLPGAVADGPSVASEEQPARKRQASSGSAARRSEVEVRNMRAPGLGGNRQWRRPGRAAPRGGVNC